MEFKTINFQEIKQKSEIEQFKEALKEAYSIYQKITGKKNEKNN